MHSYQTAVLYHICYQRKNLDLSKHSLRLELRTFCNNVGGALSTLTETPLALDYSSTIVPDIICSPKFLQVHATLYIFFPFMKQTKIKFLIVLIIFYFGSFHYIETLKIPGREQFNIHFLLISFLNYDLINE